MALPASAAMQKTVTPATANDARSVADRAGARPVSTRHRHPATASWRAYSKPSPYMHCDNSGKTKTFPFLLVTSNSWRVRLAPSSSRRTKKELSAILDASSLIARMKPFQKVESEVESAPWCRQILKLPGDAAVTSEGRRMRLSPQLPPASTHSTCRHKGIVTTWTRG